jgi:hypothetical protein
MLLLVVIIAMIITHPVASAYNDLQATTENIAAAKQQNELCLSKLNARGRMQTEKKSLEQQMAELRAVVPKEPSLDLLMLDLENICHASHVVLVGVENPESGTAEAHDDLSPKPALNVRNLLNPNLATKGEKEKGQANQPLLKQVVKEVFLAGDYDGFVQLLRKLEIYQRIIGLNNVSISVPSKETKAIPSAAKAEKLKIKQPVMSFVMTVYYLP